MYNLFVMCLQDEGVGVSCSVLEDLHEATNVNQIVRAMAVGVGAYCKAKVGFSYSGSRMSVLCQETFICRCFPDLMDIF